jgi:5-methylcytosine-specific restriction endonuclease McrA
MAQAKTEIQTERPEIGARPCLTELPYRAIVFSKLNQHKVPLYFVAGSASPASKAEKALKEAHRIHGGDCFYCKTKIGLQDLTIDHVEPISNEGGRAIQNLLIAHRKCNQNKGSLPIEAFSPEAGKEWLSALLAQVQDRLNRL